MAYSSDVSVFTFCVQRVTYGLRVCRRRRQVGTSSFEPACLRRCTQLPVQLQGQCNNSYFHYLSESVAVAGKRPDSSQPRWTKGPTPRGRRAEPLVGRTLEPTTDVEAIVWISGYRPRRSGAGKKRWEIGGWLVQALIIPPNCRLGEWKTMAFTRGCHETSRLRLCPR